MTFDIQAAKKAGYTDAEIQAHLQGQDSGGQQGGQNPLQSFLQGASGVARNLGLGMIPDAAGAAYDLTAGGGAQEMARQAAGQETPQTASSFLQAQNNNPFISPQQISQNYSTPQQAAISGGKNILGAASWAVPETKILKAGEGANLGIRALFGILNRGVQGAVQGGLGAASQGQDIGQGATTGAITNPIMTGAGKLVTDALPAYIGWRNFGNAGLNLPAVTKAEGAAAKVGKTLGDIKNEVAGAVKPFDAPAGGVNIAPADQISPQTLTKALLGEAKKTPTQGISPIEAAFPAPTPPSQSTDVLSPERQALLDKINTLAKQPEWTGTPGLSDLTKTAKKVLPTQTGKLPTLQSVIANATDPFDAYNKIKNMAYPTDNTPAANKLSSFLHTAAHVARENLINSTDNPAATRKAMDLYATQTAMNVAGRGDNALMGAAKGGGGEAGLAALASFIPGLQGLGVAGIADAALTNKYTGPALAKGLVNTGQVVGNSGLGDILRRLGIAGVQGATQGQNGATQ